MPLAELTHEVNDLTVARSLNTAHSVSSVKVITALNAHRRCLKHLSCTLLCEELQHLIFCTCSELTHTIWLVMCYVCNFCY